MGCGDARLAKTLDDGSHLENIFSCDLAQNGNAYITRACSMSDTRLPEGSIDVVIYCLSLMGTDWISFVQEGVRIARKSAAEPNASHAEVWIAEVKSRFETQDGHGASRLDTEPFIRACEACGLSLSQTVRRFSFFCLEIATTPSPTLPPLK